MKVQFIAGLLGFKFIYKFTFNTGVLKQLVNDCTALLSGGLYVGYVPCCCTPHPQGFRVVQESCLAAVFCAAVKFQRLSRERQTRRTKVLQKIQQHNGHLGMSCLSTSA